MTPDQLLEQTQQSDITKAGSNSSILRVPKTTSSSGTVTRNFSEDTTSLHSEDIEGECFVLYGNQVGGHHCLVKATPESHSIFVKPLVPRSGANEDTDQAASKELELVARQVVLKPLERLEHRFYTNITEEVPTFLPHMARLFGTKTLTHRQVSEVDKLAEEKCRSSKIRMNQGQTTYIVLEDLASSMKRPRILDLKMGCKQRSKQHSQQKREAAHKKAVNSTSHILGFRICGLRTEGYAYDKYWGRKLPVEGMQEVLAGFFLHEQASEEERCRVLTGFLDSVRRLRELIMGMPRWRFWSASLLFLFDSEDLRAEPVMRMIDLANCTCVRGAEPDWEFLCGLRNIELFLEAIRDRHPYEPWIRERLVEPPVVSVQDAEEKQSDEDTPRSSRRETDDGAEVANVPAHG